MKSLDASCNGQVAADAVHRYPVALQNLIL